MDLRVYYEKLKAIESEIKDPFPVLVSRETPDGGKAGLLTHTPRAVAARLIADGKADLAGAEEASAFLAGVNEDWLACQEEMDPPAKSPAARRSVKAQKKA